jgi:hypothetical protein
MNAIFSERVARIHIQTQSLLEFQKDNLDIYTL